MDNTFVIPGIDRLWIVWVNLVPFVVCIYTFRAIVGGHADLRYVIAKLLCLGLVMMALVMRLFESRIQPLMMVLIMGAAAFAAAKAAKHPEAVAAAPAVPNANNPQPNSWLKGVVRFLRFLFILMLMGGGGG